MRKAFYNNLELDIFDSVYDPREDSFLLADCIQREDFKGKTVLDMCCGSGIQSIISAKKGAIVTAVDLNPEAVKCTKHNSEKNKVKVNTIQSDLFQNVKGKFDVIVSNPPYLQGDEGDIALDGGERGRKIIDKLVAESKDFLNDDGFLLIVVSSMNDFYKGEIVGLNHIFFEDIFVKKIKKSEL